MTQYTKKHIDQATIDYYEGRESGISDSDYDRAFDELFPDIDPLDRYRQLRQNSAGGPKTNLIYPMLSLDKVRDIDSLSKWVAKMTSAGATRIRLSPKWDGLAVQVVVKNRSIVSAVTRGTGHVGEDVTDMFSLIDGSGDIGDGVHGVEVVMTTEDFSRLPEDGGYTNPRNAASGILRRNPDTHGDLAAYLSIRTHWTDYADATSFNVSDGPITESDMDSYYVAVREYQSKHNEAVATDGVVLIAENDDGILRSVGEGSTTPRYAVAWKFESPSEVTVLSDVTWQSNRTKMAPVGHFTPSVFFDGVEVSKASLHNIDIIRKKGLAIGDMVRVARSNEVIPDVIEVVQRGDDRTEIVAPEMTDVSLRQRVKLVVDVFDIKNVGPKAIDYISEWIEDDHDDGSEISSSEIVEAMHHGLTVDKISSFPRYGESSSRKMRDSIDYALRDDAGIQKWFAVIGLPAMGRRKFSSIFSNTSGVEEFTQILRDDELDKLDAIEGVGEVMKTTILDNKDEILDMCDYVSSSSVIDQFAAGETEGHGSSAGEFDSANIVVTGKVDGATRNDISEHLTDKGAKIQSSVSADTTVLLVGGDKPSTKTKKADKLGVPTVHINSFDEVDDAVRSLLL